MNTKYTVEQYLPNLWTILDERKQAVCHVLYKPDAYKLISKLLVADAVFDTMTSMQQYDLIGDCGSTRE